MFLSETFFVLKRNSSRILVLDAKAHKLYSYEKVDELSWQDSSKL